MGKSMKLPRVGPHRFDAVSFSKIDAGGQSFIAVSRHQEACKEGPSHGQEVGQRPVQVAEAIRLQLTAARASHDHDRSSRV